MEQEVGAVDFPLHRPSPARLGTIDLRTYAEGALHLSMLNSREH
ncbi:hypothetical protein [Kitasatospora purpeofusca]